MRYRACWTQLDVPGSPVRVLVPRATARLNGALSKTGPGKGRPEDTVAAGSTIGDGHDWAATPAAMKEAAAAPHARLRAVRMNAVRDTRRVTCTNGSDDK